MFDKLLFSDENISRSNQVSNYFLNDFCSSFEEANVTIKDKVNYLNNELLQYLSFKEKLIRFLIFNKYKIYLLIFMLSTIVSLLALVITKVSLYQFSLKLEYTGDNFWLFLLVNIICGLLAVFICDKISPEAVGSGIPEIKSVLSGVEYHNLLSISTIVAKMLSIIFVKISGLGIGFEAAFIHITAAVGKILSKMEFFDDLLQDEQKLAIAGSICVGMVVAFGTPIGAVILSIELFTTSFQVSFLFKSFFAASLSFFYYQLLQNYFSIQKIKTQIWESIIMHELYLFAILGLLCGVLASAFLYIYSQYKIFQRNSRYVNNKYIYIIFITITISFLCNFHNSFNYGFKAIISDLISVDDLRSDETIIQWQKSNMKIITDILYNIFAWFVMLFFFTTAAIPFGIFTPGLVLGCLIGRLYGEIFCKLSFINTEPAMFAACATAAFISSITKTFSSLIIVLEMTGQMNLIFPMLLTSLFAFLVTGTFNIGFFDLIIMMKQLPYMPVMLKQQQLENLAKEICQPINHYFTQKSTIIDVMQIFLEKIDILNVEQIPVVDIKTQRLIGVVFLKDCFQKLLYLKQLLMDVKENIEAEDTKMMKSFLKDQYKKYSVQNDFYKIIDFALEQMHFLDNINFNKKEKFINKQLYEKVGKDIFKSS